MKRQQTIAATVLALSVLTGGVYYKSQVAAEHANAGATTADKPNKDKGAKDAPKPIMTVERIALAQSTLPKTLAVSGGIYPWQEMIVGSESSGLKINQVLVDVGSHVRKGQTLATLSHDVIAANIAQLDATIESAKVNLQAAQQKAKRSKMLSEGDVISVQQDEEYQTAVLIAKANLSAAQAARNAAAVNLSKTTISAPDAGVITSRTAALGSIVQVGSELFRMIRQNRLEWRAELTAEQLSHIQTGQTVQIQLSNGQSINAKVRSKAPVVNDKTRKALVYVDVPNTPLLQSGMFASGKIELGLTSTLTLPQSAVIYRDGYAYIFVIDDKNRVHPTKVQTGDTVGEQVEILTAFSAQTYVVKSGGGFLNEGDWVAIADAANSVAQAD